MFMDSCIFYIKDIEIEWEYIIIKAEAEGADQNLNHLFEKKIFKRPKRVKTGRDGAVYDEKVIILNIFFCSLNNLSNLVGQLFAQKIFPLAATGIN